MKPFIAATSEFLSCMHDGMTCRDASLRKLTVTFSSGHGSAAHATEGLLAMFNDLTECIAFEFKDI